MSERASDPGIYVYEKLSSSTVASHDVCSGRVVRRSKGFASRFISTVERPLRRHTRRCILIVPSSVPLYRSSIHRYLLAFNCHHPLRPYFPRFLSFQLFSLSLSRSSLLISSSPLFFPLFFRACSTEVRSTRATVRREEHRALCPTFPLTPPSHPLCPLHTRLANTKYITDLSAFSLVRRARGLT